MNDTYGKAYIYRHDAQRDDLRFVVQSAIAEPGSVPGSRRSVRVDSGAPETGCGDGSLDVVVTTHPSGGAGAYGHAFASAGGRQLAYFRSPTSARLNDAETRQEVRSSCVAGSAAHRVDADRRTQLSLARLTFDERSVYIELRAEGPGRIEVTGSHARAAISPVVKAGRWELEVTLGGDKARAVRPSQKRPSTAASANDGRPASCKSFQPLGN